MLYENFPAALKRVLTRPTDGSKFTSGELTLYVRPIDEILSHCNYESDRTIARRAAENLVDPMRHGRFPSNNLLRFAVDADGNPKLVDGHVPLEAALEAECITLWTVLCYWGEEDTAEAVYASMRAAERFARFDVTASDVSTKWLLPQA